MKSNWILLLEDDPEQARSIKGAIERRFSNVQVVAEETESEFYQRLHSLATGHDLPLAVIADVMVPWAYPDPDAPVPPDDVRVGTFRKAGLRCWARFRSHASLKEVPWVYFTVLDDETIEFDAHSDARTRYVQKSGSIQPLLEELEEFKDPHWSETEDQVTEKLARSPTMRRILLAGMQTPLKDCATTLP